MVEVTRTASAKIRLGMVDFITFPFERQATGGPPGFRRLVSIDHSMIYYQSIYEKNRAAPASHIPREHPDSRWRLNEELLWKNRRITLSPREFCSGQQH